MMRFVSRTYVVATLLQLFGTAVAFAGPPESEADFPPNNQIVDEPPIREYAWGVQRLPMDGGKIYGWKLNDAVTFGRFKGENDEFGFSVRLNARQRFEFAADGLRWRRAVGGH
jgi:hypothetical protein